MINSWDRQSNNSESIRSHVAFEFYLQMNDRSLAKMAQQARPGWSLSRLKQMSAVQNWVSRASDYDAYMAQLLFADRQKQHIKDIKFYRDQKLEASNQLRNTSFELLIKLRAQLCNIDLADLDALQLGGLLRHLTYCLSVSSEQASSCLGISELLAALDPGSIDDDQ